MITIKTKTTTVQECPSPGITSRTECPVINPVPVPLRLHHSFSTKTQSCCFFSPKCFVHQVLQEEPGLRASCFLLSISLKVLASSPKSSLGPWGFRRVVWVRDGSSWKSPWVLERLDWTRPAALLAVEPVVTHAVLGNQTAPCEVIHAWLLSWERREKNTQKSCQEQRWSVIGFLGSMITSDWY